MNTTLKLNHYEKLTEHYKQEANDFIEFLYKKNEF